MSRENKPASPRKRLGAGKARTRTSRSASVASPRTVQAKWGAEISKAGWTAVPNVFLDKIHALGLNSTEVVILIQLFQHWYTSDQPPFPGKERLARALAVNERTVQRATSHLQKLGLLGKRKRPGPTGTNEYTLVGLRDKLEPFAREVNLAKEERKAKMTSLRARKRPGQGDQ